MTIKDVALAFLEGRAAKCHNAETDGMEYHLHGNRIAFKVIGAVHLDWCGWYTGTTANHMNTILREMGRAHRVSYAKARKEEQTVITVEV